MIKQSMNLAVKGELLHLIKSYNVTEIKGRFDGSDDDGWVQDIEVQTTEKINLSDEQQHVIDRFIFDVITELSPGWELEGGSSGAVRVSFTDSNQAAIAISMTQRFLEYSKIDIMCSLEQM